MAIFCAACDRLLVQGPKSKGRAPGRCRWCGEEGTAVERQRGAPARLKRQVKRGAVCVRCGASGPLTVDHIVPLALGGTHRLENLQAMCEPCNLAKGTELA